MTRRDTTMRQGAGLRAGTRRRQGTSLVEMLFVLAASAIVVAGAATQLRALRLVADETSRRREAVETARGALDHIARRVRSATQVVKIRGPSHPHDRLELKHGDGTVYVYYKHPDLPHLKCGIGEATAVLAPNTLATFQGYDADGPVDDGDAEKIRSVAVTISTHIADTAEAVTLATRVYMRNSVPKEQVRQTLSYATAYRQTGGDGFYNYPRAFGEPDDSYASPSDAGAGAFYAFDRGDYTGRVCLIQAGMRVRYTQGEMKVTVRHGRTKEFEKVYGEDELAGLGSTWGWLWIDITDTRSSWNEGDIERLSIEVEDRRNLDMCFDSFAIRAFFEEPLTTVFWAARQGSGAYPNQWVFADLALRAPDDACAIALAYFEPTQSYRVAIPERSDELLGVQVALDGYVDDRYRDDRLEIRTALPDEGTGAGVTHVLDKNTLVHFKGSRKKGTMLADVGGDRVWTWDSLNDYEIRLRLRKGRRPRTLMADAVGWQVYYVPAQSISLQGWGEQ